MTTQISGTTGVSRVQDGVIVQADLAAPAYLPTPQTWQAVTGSRALHTAYTNSTEQPIQVYVVFQNSTVGAYHTLTINGIAFTVTDIAE